MDASTTLKRVIKEFIETELETEVNLSGQFEPIQDDRIYIELVISPDLGTAGTAEMDLTFSSLTGQGIDEKLGVVVNALQKKSFSPPDDPIFAQQFRLEETGDVELMMSTKGNERFFTKTAKLKTKYIERGDM